MPSPTDPRLDHMVLLVPYSTLKTPPEWLTNALTLQPGGRHEDGLTENKLIVLADGTYIELIAFLPDADPEKRRKHRWGRQPEAQMVDWALTLLLTADDGDRSDGPAETAFEAVRDRVDKAQDTYVYGPPVEGGRVTPDGTHLRWAVSAPHGRAVDVDDHHAPGELPFFCLDRTPRALRVRAPSSPSDRQHPCGAVGIGSVTVSVPSADMAALRRTYEAVQDTPAKMIALESVQSGFSWPLATPASVGDGLTPRLVLRELENEALLGTETPDRHGEELVGAHVRLALFTRAGEGGDGGRESLVGEVGEGRTIAIDLIPVR